MNKEDFSKANFEKPAYIWIVEYFDRSEDCGDTNEVNEMVVFEYHEKPLTQEEVEEEVRKSFTSFETDKNKSLEDVGIQIVSVKKEEC